MAVDFVVREHNRSTAQNSHFMVFEVELSFWENFDKKDLEAILQFKSPKKAGNCFREQKKAFHQKKSDESF